MNRPLRAMILAQAREHWTSWLSARHSTEAEKQLATAALMELDVMKLEAEAEGTR